MRFPIPEPVDRWFKSTPRHQDKAEGSDDATLRFLGLTTYRLVV